MANWTLDPQHTNVTFSARHMMVATVRGHFETVRGTLEFDPQHPERARVEAEIDAATLTTGLADRDNHLRSGDFLDVATHPSIAFRSTRVEPTGDDSARVTGDLTIRGVTRPVTLNVELNGLATDPWGNERAGFTASAKINREDFGLTWNVALETGGVLVGKEIKLEIDAEVIRVVEAERETALAGD